MMYSILKNADKTASREREEGNSGRSRSQLAIAFPLTRQFTRWGGWVLLFLLCGHLLFCHGCHGSDVDDELSVPPQLKQRGGESDQRGTSMGIDRANKLNAVSPVCWTAPLGA